MRAFSERPEAKRLRPSGVVPRANASGIEEMFVQNESVSLCLLLNRRTKTMRVIDFRAGASHAKRLFVLKLAKREGIEKVYTLVERDEVNTWMKLGFAKEANIPGFYKRSDAFLLGVSVDEALATEIKGSLDSTADDDDDDDVPEPKSSPAHDRAEKTLATAKKQAKALLDRPLPKALLTQVKASDVQKTLDKALKTGAALTAFEPFGRDVERRHFLLTARSGFELVASIEGQACFANAFLELLTAPSTEHEKLATISSLRTICDKLLSEGVVSCFALAPSDDLALATAFVFNGFRRTGLLVGHMLMKGERKDAIVWSRKLADPKEL
ncbi:MAG: hypothetical protein KIT84_06015 [Labilithrix sp.]|nr:hypothetical protein [Labilithrix sp.]MCW5810546.1 hypothetical protein [Labilithrix sp.]